MKIITNEEKIDEILSRGTEDIIDKEHLKKKLMSGKQLNIKFGIDPTGPKIHLGRATVLIKLRDFQDLGHKITLIIGNFTALIGDASDKDAIRTPMTEKQIKDNLKDYLRQIGKILDLKKIDIKYNKDWFGKMTAKEIIELSMNFTAQQMIQRRNFKERWDSEKPIGVHELLYPLLQGYDSVVIKSDLELGGFDQLFNLKAGRELQRAFKQEPQDVMTVRMIYGLDGRKMSTSWGNVINILDEPKDMFGKLMTLKDEMIADYFESCTRVPMLQVNEFKASLKDKIMNPKDIKKILAKEIISFFYDRKKAEEAEKEFEQTFRDKKLPSEIEEVKKEEILKQIRMEAEPGKFNLKGGEVDFEHRRPITKILTDIGLAKNNSEARRLVEQGGVRIRREKNGKEDIQEIKDWQEMILLDGEMVIQVGKRNFKKIV